MNYRPKLERFWALVVLGFVKQIVIGNGGIRYRLPRLYGVCKDQICPEQ